MPKPAILTIERQELRSDVQLFLMGPYGADMLELNQGDSTLDLHDRLEELRSALGVFSKLVDDQLVLQTYEMGSTAALELTVVGGDLSLAADAAFGCDLLCEFEGRQVGGRGEAIAFENDELRVELLVKPFADWTPELIEIPLAGLDFVS